ncbi:SDR family oxidoreductase [Palleronia sp.]|uniref:SDR family oxidoreductase n=1 Tax=Palleronia sp. TaxID=1940284 RepID=UPI0035C8378D
MTARRSGCGSSSCSGNRAGPCCTEGSVYKFHIFADIDVSFVLTSSGHNTGIVSEPGHPHRHYRLATGKEGERSIDPDTWAAQVSEIEGSWWPALADWLFERSGAPVAPPPLGAKSITALCDAPGTYVMEAKMAPAALNGSGGKPHFVVGSAKEAWIATGSAQAVVEADAELAVTYPSGRASPLGEPVAEGPGVRRILALDVEIAGQVGTVFDTGAARWAKLDFVAHSIAFVARAMNILLHSLIRLARLAVAVWLVREGATRVTADTYVDTGFHANA